MNAGSSEGSSSSDTDEEIDQLGELEDLSHSEFPHGNGCPRNEHKRSPAKDSSASAKANALEKNQDEDVGQPVEDEEWKGKKYGHKKRGPKRGAPKRDIDPTFWIHLCKQYATHREEHRAQKKKILTQKAFLMSVETPLVTGTKSEIVSFSRYLKRYDAGKFKPEVNQWLSRRKPEEGSMEDRLVTYLEARGFVFVRGDVEGVSLEFLKYKCVEWYGNKTKNAQPTGEAKDNTQVSEPLSDFKAEPTWIETALKRNNIPNKYLQKEMDARKESLAMDEFLSRFHTDLLEMKISAGSLYCAAQTTLFYRQFPRTSEQHEEERNKHVPTCDRISLMVCTAADGNKVPLAAVGQQESPFLDSSENNSDDDGDEQDEDPSLLLLDSTIPYKTHPHAWFDQETTIWWIINVFWTHHLRLRGDVPCVLLLDDSVAHTGLDKAAAARPLLPKNLRIVYFPCKMPRRRHPAEGGIIGNLKLAYKLRMTTSLLALFDLIQGFQGARKNNRVPSGLGRGDPASLLDALCILKQAWNCNQKFVTTSLVLECWNRACILPTWWVKDMDARRRNEGLPQIRQGLNDHDMLQLCTALHNLVTRVDEAKLDRFKLESTALRGCFLVMEQYGNSAYMVDNDDEIRSMARGWVEIEDDPETREAIAEYECDQILALRSSSAKMQQEKKREISANFEKTKVNIQDMKRFALDLGMEQRHMTGLDTFEERLGRLVSLKGIGTEASVDKKRKRDSPS